MSFLDYDLIETPPKDLSFYQKHTDDNHHPILPEPFWS
jgi:hypothetical protein